MGYQMLINGGPLARCALGLRYKTNRCRRTPVTLPVVRLCSYHGFFFVKSHLYIIRVHTHGKMEFISLISEPFAGGAPLVSKSGTLSIREILVVTSAHLRKYARLSVQTLREGEGNPTVEWRMPSFEKEVSLINI